MSLFSVIKSFYIMEPRIILRKFQAFNFTFIFYGIVKSSPDIIDSARSKEAKRKKEFRIETQEAHKQFRSQ